MVQWISLKEVTEYSMTQKSEIRYKGAADLYIVANMFFLLSDPREFFISI